MMQSNQLGLAERRSDCMRTREISVKKYAAAICIGGGSVASASR
jgi:hypothetical protein